MSEENGDDRRQRQMDFILEHQAKFSADIEELKAADARAVRRVDRLERLAKLFLRAGVRERQKFIERHNILLDAQIKTEEASRCNSDDIANLIVATTRADAEFRERHNVLLDAQAKSDEVTRRNSDDIANLIATTARNGDDIAELRNTVAQTSETVNRLADVVAQQAARQKGNGTDEQG